MTNALITFQELADDKEIAKKMDSLNALLNTPPRESWLKKHKFAAGVRYLPIQKVELLMSVIFQQWRREIKEIKLVANSCVAIVRVHYKNPVTGDWQYHDGVGASPLQTDEGAGANAIDKMKTNAVQLAAPAAVSYAFKDACQCLGSLFGKDLNRKDNAEFAGIYSKDPEDAPPTPEETKKEETINITTNF